jgi:hypothetical protein
MAANLVKAGFDVTSCNRSPAQADLPNNDEG